VTSDVGPQERPDDPSDGEPALPREQSETDPAGLDPDAPGRAALRPLSEAPDVEPNEPA